MFSQDDIFYMHEALREASIAFEEDEVPIGAVLVYKNQIIARGRNSIEKEFCVTKHAELICIEKASQTLGGWRLLDTTLYVTVEPCMMCAGAIQHSRISRVVWGCPNLRFGGHLAGEGGLLEEEAKRILQKFFQKKRSDGEDT